MNKTVRLADGNGGEENHKLITEVFYKAFGNEILEQSEDAAVIHKGELAFTSDSFTVDPLFFAGGDIGKLSICGTCNDLAMMGAKPKYLSCSVIIEEGFAYEMLEKIVASMQLELAKNQAIVVTGDTKVVPRGSVDKIFINTTGIGEIIYQGISASKLQEGDLILVSRDIGAHGAAIFTAREGIELSSELQSDCESLYPSVQALIDAGIKIHAMRDATRGGVSAVLHEWARASDVCIEIQEQKIPLSDEVRGICEILGFDAISLANEGTFVLAIDQKSATKALDVLKTFHSNAKIIGDVSKKELQKVILHTPWGTSRYLEAPSGELLPRIC
ncbi:MAG: hydrogenase expression/formation protein HypE [Sulfurimonas sp.]|jgi:hydrogenase expression/formation protein HypE|nr:hydrogenase expression/formation protein HypE [Sulfurimonas sp.]